MSTDTPSSELTRFAHFQQRAAMRNVIWSIFTAIEDDEACYVQGATLYASGAGVLPYRLMKQKAKP